MSICDHMYAQFDPSCPICHPRKQMRWQPITTPPREAGHYMVAKCRPSAYVYVARWQPKKKQWTFASASMAFEVTHWMPLPEPPEETE